MTTQTETGVTTQVYQVFIKATPEAIWDAITSPEWTQRYGYRAPAEYDLRPGGKYRGLATEEMKAGGAGDVLVDGEVIEADPPHKLVQTWRALWDPELEAEGFTRVTWETREETGGITRLTVTHELEGFPRHAEAVAGDAPLEQGGGGWSWILSDLKTLLESGKPLHG
ncbi:MAG TPA: SRPBCC family protein [Gaiellaceae bacterium]|nr:SRPBCC family protein [Gaiellaceae bacterium]